MTGPSPDLDALREKAEKATEHRWTITKAEWVAAVSPDVILAVLALVDEQRARISTLQETLSVLSLVDDLRAENERLREALAYVGEFARAHHHQQPAHVHLHGLTIDIPEVVERALAGSPTEKETTDA